MNFPHEFKSMTALKVMWLNGGRFGIVKVQTEYDGIKFYGMAITPTDEKNDIETIMAWGNTIDPSAIESFFTS